ncbi:MAG: DUF3298 domain-containing protein, partial [Bacteroidaceae bacterium]|nr:DUF3298 domain-containing protein [Bacteroidaceae bacterium]
LKELYDMDEEEEYLPTYSCNVTGRPKEDALAGYVAYEFYDEEYRGGAHGSYGFFYRNINLRDGHAMTRDDVFKDGCDEDVVQLMLKRLMIDNSCATMEELQEQTGIATLGDPTITDNNFVLLDDGIEFVFNIYEIAPYSSGVTVVKLTYEQLKDYLKIEI